MLDKVKSYGIDAVEMTSGGWGGCKHVDTTRLLEDGDYFESYVAELEKRNMKIVALNCSGNPLAPGTMGKEHSRTAYQTVELASKLGVKKIVMMSGLPAGSPNDQTPNWISSTISWPDYMPDTLKYQWQDVAIPWWKKFVAFAKDHGINQIALEEFPSQLVYNPETLLYLRSEVGKIIGINLDPSHLIIMGANPIDAIRPLAQAGAIFHVHGKDARIESGMATTNGLVETKSVTDSWHRAWNYVAVGCGQSITWWKEFFSVLRMSGYNDYVSLEMEDLTMSVDAGIETSIAALNQSLSK
ncbi:MAG: sugar phosphate isomerase/epimerase [Lactobacillus sp.]|nr:sugar phosphate isomerase/epimerase [Lactobacillus sp.]